MISWVAAHPGYFYFWGGFLLVLLLLFYAGIFFIHNEAKHIVNVLVEILKVQRDTHAVLKRRLL